MRSTLVAGLTACLVSRAAGQLNFATQQISSGAAPTPVYSGPVTTVGDFNGDGFPDLAFREDSATVVFRVLWGPQFAPPYTVVVVSSLSNVTLVPRSGDADGDGYDDLLIGAVTFGGPSASPGQIFIRYGPSLTTETVVTYTLPGGSVLLGAFYEVADLNGDGTADLVSWITTGPPYWVGPSYLQVLYGPGFSTGPTLSAPAGAGGSGFGATSVDGDFTGDGLPDILAVTSAGTGQGVVLFPGPSFQSSTATLLANVPTSIFGSFLWAGELTGDGIADGVLATSPGTSAGGLGMDLWLVPSPGFGTTGPIVGPWGCCYPQAITAGDMDGDGSRDLLVGTGNGQFNNPGIVWLTYASSFTTTQWLAGPSSGANLGWVIIAKDVDGDGFREVISPATGDNLVMVFRPKTLTASGTGVSLSAGGSVSLSIDASPSHGGEAYLIVCSTTGTYPGTLVGNIRVPILVDSFTFAALTVVNSPVLANFAGFLDANGRATATLTVPPGAFTNPALVGLTINLADVVLNPALTAVQVSSNPVSVTLLP
ncbi:MAG TPA: VCBS repeat-containing protein [Planctomycetota bacterium]|jgi:hypothetical protein|nr:VCBS repeat-containing protein [Planctomycetota bacterium]